MIFDWLAADTGLSIGDLRSKFDDWEVHYHLENGQRAAAALLKGTEVHFVVAPEWRRKLIRRDNTKAFLGALLNKNGGWLTTRLLIDSAGPASFIQRIGFQKTWTDGVFNYYALCRLPFERRAP